MQTIIPFHIFQFLLCRCAVCRRIERSKEHRQEPVTHQPPPELVARPESRYPQHPQYNQPAPPQYNPQPPHYNPQAPHYNQPPPPRRTRVQGVRPNYQNPNLRSRQNYPTYQYRQNQ